MTALFDKDAFDVTSAVFANAECFAFLLSSRVIPGGVVKGTPLWFPVVAEYVLQDRCRCVDGGQRRAVPKSAHFQLGI